VCPALSLTLGSSRDATFKIVEDSTASAAAVAGPSYGLVPPCVEVELLDVASCILCVIEDLAAGLGVPKLPSFTTLSRHPLTTCHAQFSGATSHWTLELTLALSKKTVKRGALALVQSIVPGHAVALI
jgi:hypothetical protein